MAEGNKLSYNALESAIQTLSNLAKALRVTIKKPKIGAVALNDGGFRGLITGRKDGYWVGWSSKNPKVVGHI